MAKIKIEIKNWAAFDDSSSSRANARLLAIDYDAHNNNNKNNKGSFVWKGIPQYKQHHLLLIATAVVQA